MSVVTDYERSGEGGPEIIGWQRISEIHDAVDELIRVVPPRTVVETPRTVPDVANLLNLSDQVMADAADPQKRQEQKLATEAIKADGDPRVLTAQQQVNELAISSDEYKVGDLSPEDLN